MSGIKGRSGRRPKPSTEWRAWETNNPGKLSQLIDKLCDMGISGDREAAIYVINRFGGTPSQSIDHRIKQTTLILTASDYEQLQFFNNEIATKENLLLGSGGSSTTERDT